MMMKTYALVVMGCLGFGVGAIKAETPQAVYRFEWKAVEAPYWWVIPSFVPVSGYSSLREIDGFHSEGKLRWDMGDAPVVEITRDSSQALPGPTMLSDLYEVGNQTVRYVWRGEMRTEIAQGYIYPRMRAYADGKEILFSHDATRWEGSTDWKSFELTCVAPHVDPAYFERGSSLHLELRIEWNGGGTVYLRNLQVIEYGELSPPNIGDEASADAREGKADMNVRRVWWSDRVAGWIGSVGGVVLGLIGVWLGFLGRRGTMPRWVEGVLATLTIEGLLLLIGGGVALACRQPYGVWYPLLLFGVIMAAVFGLNWAIFRRKRREIELRRMASLDSVEG